MTKTTPEYYRFIKMYKVGGITIYPGVSIKGEFNVHDDLISLKDSEMLSGIPQEYLETYIPESLEKKSRKK